MHHTIWINHPAQHQTVTPVRTYKKPVGKMTMTHPFQKITNGYTPISLKQMDAVALLNRIDIKYVMTTAQLLSILTSLKEDYWILSVHGQRLNHYHTLYFDTPDFELYRQHVNGRAERYKVRSREYTDTSLSFLEVKHKTRKGRTIKDRIPTEQPVSRMNRETENWLHKIIPYDSRLLEPKLANTFTRITLVSKQVCERVTLDIDLTFTTNEKSMRMEGIAIAEVKMDSAIQISPFSAQMRANKIHPQSFSKYCMGVAMLYDNVKKNTIKPKFLKIKKLTGGIEYHG